MKKLLLLFLAGLAMSVTHAQQLPNGDFSSWESSCDNTFAMSSSKNESLQRPGVEPTSWNGSSIHQKVKVIVTVTKKEELIFNEDNAVKMVNKFVGAMGIGSVAPGFINLGTPWVYASTTLSECDGGVYGGVEFTHKPDAITGRYKRTDSTGENSHIIVYLWNGTYSSKIGKQGNPSQATDNVERAIMGMTDPTAAGTLVASCDYTFTTTGGDWETITVPLEYTEGITEAPTMMNTIISGGDYWTRANMQENTTLYADDLRFVYYSTLRTLSYDGVELPVPSVGDTLDMSSVAFDAEKVIAYTLNGQTASAVASYNETSGVLEIAVSNVDNDIDGQSTHIYYVQFAEPAHAHGSLQYMPSSNGITVICGECNAELGTISMILPTSIIYDGQPKEVTLEGSIADMDTPTVVYSCGESPVHVGTYTASITMGDVTVTVEFTIEPKEISGAAVGNFEPMTYSGLPQIPVASVTIDGYGAVTGEWSEVTNVGDMAVFTATGNFVGTLQCEVDMMPMELGEEAVAGVSDSCDYTGEAIVFDLLVYNGDIQLVEGTDYTVAYSDNVEVGTATVTIVLMGNYSGTLTLTFEIVDTTGIENSQFIIHNSGIIYDLHGRRVENPTKGIYIINGRKVVLTSK